MRGINRRNGLKTGVLLGGMWAVLIFLIYVFGWVLRSPVWPVIMLLVGVAQTAYCLWGSDKLPMRAMGAIEVTAAQQPRLYAIVRELSTAAGQPMPRLYVAPTMSPNAFACGRSPSRAAVCCTQGILQLLDDRELRGVLSHELSHVYNRDILASSVATGMAAAICAYPVFLMSVMALSERRGRRAPRLLAVFLPLIPLAVAVTRFAVSRTREFDADHDGAVRTRDPLALASALSKLEWGISRVPMGNDPRLALVSSMMIANPFGRSRSLLATHPPLEQRIARLRQMTIGY